MRILAAAALALATISSAHAAEQASAKAAVKNGDTIRDAAMARIGEVSRVYPDGSVQVIVGSRFVVIPANTVSIETDGKVKTSLTRAEVRKLK